LFFEILWQLKGKPFTHTTFFAGNQQTMSPKYPKVKVVGMVFLVLHVLPGLDDVGFCENETENFTIWNEKMRKIEVIGK